MTTHELLLKIEQAKLRQWDEDDQLLLDEYTKTVSDYEAYQVLAENPLVQRKIEKWMEELKAIDYKLANDRDLIMDPNKKVEAAELFARKNVLKDFINELSINRHGQEITTIEENIKRFIR
jgi:hypothetical protein